MPYKNKEKQLECQRRWYRNNKDKVIKEHKIREAKLTKYINSFKNKCERCDETHIACLEFHHLNPKEKEISISLIVSNKGWSKERILKEIEKCIVLCSNCHRKLHYEMRL